MPKPEKLGASPPVNKGEMHVQIGCLARNRIGMVYINQEALVSAPRSGAARKAVMDFVRSLAADPYYGGDFAERDDVGRTVHVKIVGRYAITFWPDHAVSEVKVTHIKPADK